MRLQGTKQRTTNIKMNTPFHYGGAKGRRGRSQPLIRRQILDFQKDEGQHGEYWTTQLLHFKAPALQRISFLLHHKPATLFWSHIISFPSCQKCIEFSASIFCFVPVIFFFKPNESFNYTCCKISLPTLASRHNREQLPGR